MDRIRVAVLLGGPSSEHDVSLKSGANVVDALDRKRYEVRPVLITREGRWRVAARPIEAGGRNGKPGRPFDPLSPDTPWRDPVDAWMGLGELVDWKTDVALPILHGRFGEDGTVQACLHAAGIRFAGSGVRASAVAIDKIRTKEVLSFHGVRTAPFRILDSERLAGSRPELAAELAAELGLPLVVKDPLGGSSLEVAVCDDEREAVIALDRLAKGRDRLLAESFVKGREFTGGVLADRERGSPVALPLVELRPVKAKFFDYREKYDADGAQEICPADLPAAVEAAGRALALEVHELIGLKGVSRTDMILDEATGRFSVLEVNTMPGMTARSLIPKAAAVAGIEFADVIDRLIRTAGSE